MAPNSPAAEKIADLLPCGHGGFEICEHCGGEGRLYIGHPNDPSPRDGGECPSCEGTCREWHDDQIDEEAAKERTYDPR